MERLALALDARGLRCGDRLAILSENRPEWAMADFACALLGVVSVPIYHTLTPDQTAYILRDAGARWMLCSDPGQLAKVLPVLDRLPELEALVLLDGRPAGSQAGPDLVTWARPAGGGRGAWRPGAPVRGWAAERRPGGPADPHLHLGHHRRPQGRHAQPRQPGLQLLAA